LEDLFFYVHSWHFIHNHVTKELTQSKRETTPEMLID